MYELVGGEEEGHRGDFLGCALATERSDLGNPLVELGDILLRHLGVTSDLLDTCDLPNDEFEAKVKSLSESAPPHRTGQQDQALSRPVPALHPACIQQPR
jgi:hypothetical protein